MNWKTILKLIDVDLKAGRLVRGARKRRYMERSIFRYALYIGAAALGVVVGLLVGNFYVNTSDAFLKELMFKGAMNLYSALPTLVLIFGVIFTLMTQIQMSGLKLSVQPPYWFPITWEEHTFAIAISTLLGVPIGFALFLATSVSVASLFLGLTPLAMLTIFAIVIALLLASLTTEILRVLQVRLTGAVYKSSGKAAVWVRFVSMLLFFIVFYVLWFSITSGMSSLLLIESVANFQSMIWFFPYVWLGTALSFFAKNSLLETTVFLTLSVLFLLALFKVAVKLNTRFGLYEPPAITVSRGRYAPKVGILMKMGFSTVEAALLRKDFRAFTRRRELMSFFILPILVVIMPLLQFLSAESQTPFSSNFIYLFTLWMPGALTAMMLGSVMIGMEGTSMWLLYSSPINAKSLLKAKYSFILLFSYTITFICGILSAVLTGLRGSVPFIFLVESLFLIFSVGMVSLSIGVKGADFMEFPRPRMIRTRWGILNFLLSLLIVGLVISPTSPFLLEPLLRSVNAPFSIFIPQGFLYLALLASGVIAIAITYIFYRVALRNLVDLLRKAEI